MFDDDDDDDPCRSYTERTVAHRYYVGAMIGQGATSQVIAGHCIETGRPVALKILTRTGPGTALARFLREAKAAAAIRHPNVAQVYDAGTLPDGTPYIAMELVEGEPLHKRLLAGPLSIPDAVSITVQLLSALTAAHDAGIVHRDVKPSNIVVRGAPGAPPRIKLIDFGLAKVLRESPIADEDATPLTTRGILAGTPWYLPPEQVKLTHPVDPRTDVWSAGLTFYEMLTGRRVYDGVTKEEVMKRIAFDKPTPIETLRPDVPPEVVSVINRAVCRSHGKRFENAARFGAALVDAWATHRLRAIVGGRRRDVSASSSFS